MKKQILLLGVLVFFLFPSCEKETLEPDTKTPTSLDAVVKSQARGKQLSFKAHLTGDQEVDPVDTQATGQALFRLSKDGTELYYKLIVANIENVTMAHIHLAPVGDNGSVVAWLYPSGPPPQLIEGKSNGILAEGVITSEDLVGPLADANLEELLENMISGNTYVNVHTQAHGGGEIRGQISANNYN